MPSIGKPSLQAETLFAAKAFRHSGFAPCPLLSIKTMRNGTALYRVGRNWFAVNEGGYLILNDQQPYEIEIDSPTRVKSFIIYFPRDWAHEVLRSLSGPADRLLDDPTSGHSKPLHFFERFTPNDRMVTPVIASLQRRHEAGRMSDLWLEERLRDLLARMLEAQRQVVFEINAFKAQRAATREELWRRLNRARDFIRAHFEDPLTLTEISAVACLSPFHFLRGFKELFQTTPHDFLSACRVGRARFLLTRTELPVTEICFAVGFESLGSFSSWFRKLSGASPREWRKKQKSNFEEVSRSDLV